MFQSKQEYVNEFFKQVDDGLIHSLRLPMYFELCLQLAGLASSSARALILMGRHTQQKKHTKSSISHPSDRP